MSASTSSAVPLPLTAAAHMLRAGVGAVSVIITTHSPTSWTRLRTAVEHAPHNSLTHFYVHPAKWDFLNIPGAETACAAFVRAVISTQCASLQEFDMDYHFMHPFVQSAVADLFKECTNITRINLSSNVHVLANAPCPALRDLTVETKHTDEATLLAFLQRPHPDLRSVRLTMCNAGRATPTMDEILTTLFKYPAPLENLCIDVPLSDPRLRQLGARILAPDCTYKTLDIRFEDMAEKDALGHAKYLAAAVGHNTSIQSLSVNSVHSSDETIYHWARAAAKNTTLRSLAVQPKVSTKYQRHCKLIQNYVEHNQSEEKRKKKLKWFEEATAQPKPAAEGSGASQS